jgi:hypothetical protein
MDKVELRTYWHLKIFFATEPKTLSLRTPPSSEATENPYIVRWVEGNLLNP